MSFFLQFKASDNLHDRKRAKDSRQSGTQQKAKGKFSIKVMSLKQQNVLFDSQNVYLGIKSNQETYSFVFILVK